MKENQKRTKHRKKLERHRRRHSKVQVGTKKLPESWAQDQPSEPSQQHSDRPALMSNEVMKYGGELKDAEMTEATSATLQDVATNSLPENVSTLHHRDASAAVGRGGKYKEGYVKGYHNAYEQIYGNSLQKGYCPPMLSAYSAANPQQTVQGTWASSSASQAPFDYRPLSAPASIGANDQPFSPFYYRQQQEVPLYLSSPGSQEDSGNEAYNDPYVPYGETIPALDEIDCEMLEETEANSPMLPSSISDYRSRKGTRRDLRDDMAYETEDTSDPARCTEQPSNKKPGSVGINRFEPSISESNMMVPNMMEPYMMDDDIVQETVLEHSAVMDSMADNSMLEGSMLEGSTYDDGIGEEAMVESHAAEAAIITECEPLQGDIEESHDGTGHEASPYHSEFEAPEADEVALEIMEGGNIEDPSMMEAENADSTTRENAQSSTASNIDKEASVEKPRKPRPTIGEGQAFVVVPPDAEATEASLDIDHDGVPWIIFEYPRGYVKRKLFRVRCDIENMQDGGYEQLFLEDNCIYPGAMVPPEEYRGHRREYETYCNDIGWKLVSANPVLYGQRGLTQRAVDTYRNTSEDISRHSRKARRLARKRQKMQNSKVRYRRGKH